MFHNYNFLLPATPLLSAQLYTLSCHVSALGLLINQNKYRRGPQAQKRLNLLFNFIQCIIVGYSTLSVMSFCCYSAIYSCSRSICSRCARQPPSVHPLYYYPICGIRNMDLQPCSISYSMAYLASTTTTTKTNSPEIPPTSLYLLSTVQQERHYIPL